MDSNDRFRLGLWFIIGLTVWSLAWTVAWGVNRNTQLFVTHGYVEEMQIGSQYARWVKP